MRLMKLSFVFIIAFLYAEFSFAQGNGVGGGGDGQESRVSDIREDILSWILRGGSKGLVFPVGITLEEYNQKMIELLRPKAVIVSFIEKDHPFDEEKQVIVAGKDKTCRGFLSRSTNKLNILCNIARFKKTSPSDQYRLIHHEYAGLGYLERNDGAASDYTISAQITDYLSEVTITKLALVKKKAKIEDPSNGKTITSKKTEFSFACERVKKSQQVYRSELSEERALGVISAQLSAVLIPVEKHYEVTMMIDFGKNNSGGFHKLKLEKKFIAKNEGQGRFGLYLDGVDRVMELEFFDREMSLTLSHSFDLMPDRNIPIEGYYDYATNCSIEKDTNIILKKKLRYLFF